MAQKLKKEIFRFLEYIDKEREWLVGYENNLQELQKAIEQKNESKAKKVIKTLAFSEKRIFQFQEKIKAFGELFEKEFLVVENLSVEKSKLPQLEERLVLYGNMLLAEISQGLLGPKGKIPALIQRKPLPLEELQKETQEVSEKIIAPLLVLIYDLQEEVFSILQQYQQRRKTLAAEIQYVRGIDSFVLRTPKGDIESRLLFSFADLIKELSKKRKPVKILDLGCGNGTCLKQLQVEYESRVELHGLSIRQEEGWTPQEQGIHWHVGHVEKLSAMFSRNYFDFIYSHLGALMHGTNLRKALYQCFLVLRPGGILIFNATKWDEDVQKTSIPLFQPLRGEKLVIAKDGFSLIIQLKKK